MIRIGCWVTVVLLFSGSLTFGAKGAGPQSVAKSKAVASLEQGMRDFERNTALGVALTMRPGTPAELKELQGLAERGPRSAEDLAAEYPDSADAHYLLGSWLIYGYRVQETRQITVDPQGGQRAQILPRVVQGMSDDCEAGLAALKRTSVLAPGQGRYLIDYGAALFDCNRPLEAMGYLKAAWVGQRQLTAAEKMEIGVLLSWIYASQGMLREAREWVYSALSVRPENTAAVQCLRELDAAQAAAVEAPVEEWEFMEGATEEPLLDQGGLGETAQEALEEEVAPDQY